MSSGCFLNIYINTDTPIYDAYLYIRNSINNIIQFNSFNISILLKKFLNHIRYKSYIYAFFTYTDSIYNIYIISTSYKYYIFVLLKQK